MTRQILCQGKIKYDPRYKKLDRGSDNSKNAERMVWNDVLNTWKLQTTFTVVTARAQPVTWPTRDPYRVFLEPWSYGSSSSCVLSIPVDSLTCSLPAWLYCHLPIHTVPYLHPEPAPWQLFTTSFLTHMYVGAGQKIHSLHLRWPRLPISSTKIIHIATWLRSRWTASRCTLVAFNADDVGAVGRLLVYLPFFRLLTGVAFISAMLVISVTAYIAEAL